MRTGAIDIRRVQLDFDLDQLKVLYGELHEHQIAGAPTVAGFPARSVSEAWPGRQERYRDWMSVPDSFMLLARCNGVLIGYAVVTLASGYDGWESRGRVGELKELVVTASRRGQNVGTALLESVERELRAIGIGAYRLNVVAGNDSASTFYGRSGFEVVATTLIKAL